MRRVMHNSDLITERNEDLTDRYELAVVTIFILSPKTVPIIIDMELKYAAIQIV